MPDPSDLIELIDADEQLAELKTKCKVKHGTSGWTIELNDPDRTTGIHVNLTHITPFIIQ